jgi:hypothetical protein
VRAQTVNHNQDAYRQLKGHIDATYVQGEFVGIVGGAVVADATTFQELLTKLDSLERHPSRRFIVQAGQSYPTEAVIRLMLGSSV